MTLPLDCPWPFDRRNEDAYSWRFVLESKQMGTCSHISGQSYHVQYMLVVVGLKALDIDSGMKVPRSLECSP